MFHYHSVMACVISSQELNVLSPPQTPSAPTPVTNWNVEALTPIVMVLEMGPLRG